MASRDDMVIRPRLDDQQPSTMTRAREERRLAGGRRKGGVLSVVSRAMKARKLQRLRRRFQSEQKVMGAARKKASKLQYLKAPTSSVGMLGLVAMVGVVGAAVWARERSGRSFENLGNQLNQMFLGDMDDKARAAMSVRNRISSDGQLARIAGIEGKVNAQIRSIQSDLLGMAERDEKGKSQFLLDKEFEVPTTLDNLIDRVKGLFRSEFQGTTLAQDVGVIIPLFLGISTFSKAGKRASR